MSMIVNYSNRSYRPIAFKGAGSNARKVAKKIVNTADNRTIDCIKKAGFGAIVIGVITKLISKTNGKEEIQNAMKQKAAEKSSAINNDTSQTVKPEESIEQKPKEQADNVKKHCYPNGQPSIELREKGMSYGWYEDGSLVFETEKSDNGEIVYSKSYYANGKIMGEYKDGTDKEYFADGSLRMIFYPDGTKESFYRNGALKSKRMPNEEEQFFDTEGNLIDRNTAEDIFHEQEKEFYEQDCEQLIQLRKFQSRHHRLYGGWK